MYKNTHTDEDVRGDVSSFMNVCSYRSLFVGGSGALLASAWRGLIDPLELLDWENIMRS